MTRLGIFIDVSNLYHSIGHILKGKLDYKAYLEFIEPFGTITVARAYGAYSGNETEGFIKALKLLGITPVFKQVKEFGNRSGVKHKGDCDVDIAVDALKMVDDYDTFILGSADGDMCPLLEELRSKGKQTIVIACHISSDLRGMSTKAIEIPSTLVTKSGRVKDVPNHAKRKARVSSVCGSVPVASGA